MLLLLTAPKSQIDDMKEIVALSEGVFGCPNRRNLSSEAVRLVLTLSMLLSPDMRLPLSRAVLVNIVSLLSLLNSFATTGDSFFDT